MNSYHNGVPPKFIKIPAAINFTLTASFISLALALAVLSVPVGVSHAGPAAPRAINATQPDGSPITIKGRGDEWANWTETADGYSISKASNGYWYYVQSSSSTSTTSTTSSPFSGSQALTPDPSGPVPAHLPPPTGLAKHIRTSARTSQSTASYSGITPFTSQALVAPTPSTGDRFTPLTAPTGAWAGKVVFILAEFTDRVHTHPASGFVPLMSGVADYYNKVSSGAVTISPATETHGTANDGIVGWINLGYAHPNPGAASGRANRDIARDAIVAAGSYINYASYDTNADGYVTSDELAIVVITAGYEASYNSAPSPSVWGQAWCVFPDEVPPTVGGVILGSCQPSGTGYSQVGEIHGDGVTTDHILALGVLVHELGHQITAVRLKENGLNGLTVGAPEFFRLEGEDVDKGFPFHERFTYHTA